jgi:hypothetical protein
MTVSVKSRRDLALQCHADMLPYDFESYDSHIRDFVGEPGPAGSLAPPHLTLLNLGIDADRRNTR